MVFLGSSFAYGCPLISRLIISWTRRFYSVLFLAVFFFHLYKLWTNSIWPEIRGKSFCNFNYPYTILCKNISIFLITSVPLPTDQDEPEERLACVSLFVFPPLLLTLNINDHHSLYLIFNHSWTPVHPQAFSAPEINYYIDVMLDLVACVFDWFVELRKQNHGFFCLLVSSIFVLTAFIGKAVPGVLIVYTLRK